MISPLLFLALAKPLLAVCTLARDPFYVSDTIVQDQQSRYDLRAPKVVGIITVDGKKSAFICFDDDQKEVVTIGDQVRGHVVVTIEDKEVVVMDRVQREKRWAI